jgi:hypothetical protein
MLFRVVFRFFQLSLLFLTAPGSRGKYKVLPDIVLVQEN